LKREGGSTNPQTSEAPKPLPLSSIDFSTELQNRIKNRNAKAEEETS